MNREDEIDRSDEFKCLWAPVGRFVKPVALKEKTIRASDTEDQLDMYKAVAAFNANLTTVAIALVTLFSVISPVFVSTINSYTAHHKHGTLFWLAAAICALGGLIGVAYVGGALMAYNMGDFFTVPRNQRKRSLQDFVFMVEQRRAWLARGVFLLILPLAMIVGLFTSK